MPQSAGSGLRKWATIRNVLTAALVCEAVMIGIVIAAELARRRAEQARMTYKLNPGVLWLDNRAKPVLRPPIIQATSAKVRPEDLVIGVEVGGKARAYRLGAFDDRSRHLVSDIVGDVPVLVAYCNISRCARVYTSTKGSRPVDAEVVGLLNQQMVLKLAGNLYFHGSGSPVEPAKSPPPMPYGVLTPNVTTWKAWTRLHPQTDVYVGGL